MELFVKVVPLRAGTSEPAGEPRLVRCPPEVEPDTVLSYLTQQLGEAIDTARTSTGHHANVGIGWVFPGAPATGPGAVEWACVPFTEGPEGSLQPMFEVQADLRRQFTELTDSHSLDITIIQQPHRPHHPAAQAGQDTSTPPAGPVGGPTKRGPPLRRLAGGTDRLGHGHQHWCGQVPHRAGGVVAARGAGDRVNNSALARPRKSRN